MPSRTQILSSLILAQVWLSTSHFEFDLEVDLRSVTAVNCDMGAFESSQCQVYFSVFCLREERADSQSTDENDCPLGRNTERLNTYLENQPNTIRRRITSHRQWPVSFQLYIKARDSDPGPTDDDDLDDIFIGHTLQLEANTGFTEMKKFTGILNRVNFRARFRVTCQQNYYGAHCNTHCVPRNDRNGHYKCNSDGSIQCLEGFENPNNNCTDMINPCDSNPCTNNGSCIQMGRRQPVDYTCQCAAGYTGLNCEATINDCRSATCPNNSICVDSDEISGSYHCKCNPGSMQNGSTMSCVQNPVTQEETQGTQILPDGGTGITTSTAGEANSEPSTEQLMQRSSGKESGSQTSTIVAIVITLALIGFSLFIFIVVLMIVVIIKWRRKKTHSNANQGGRWMENLSAKMMDSPTYGQLSDESTSANVIYEVPTHTSLDATVHIVDNPIYGEDANYSPVNDEVIHDVQNPIYGDNANSNAL